MAFNAGIAFRVCWGMDVAAESEGSPSSGVCLSGEKSEVISEPFHPLSCCKLLAQPGPAPRPEIC